ncbi:MAG: ArnT family glycosyltransferase [Lachnospiraceae bacterium]
MRKMQDKYLLILYLLVFFGVAATIAFLQPHADTLPLLANPPDEAYRYLVPRYICRHGTLPNGYDAEIRIPSYGFSYAFYNMFPYIVQGYIMRFVNLFTDSELVLLYTARMVNVLCGTAMAAVVFGIGNRIFSDRRFKWLFCVLVMYMPQSLFTHTYVNTDSMCLLSTALIIYALVRAWQESFTWKNCLWLSGGIILCALSYYNAYGFILSSIFLFVARFFYRDSSSGKIRYNWKEMWKKGGFIAGVVLLGIGWYFIRNAVLYDGDFLGLKSRELCASMYASAEQNPLYANTYASQGVSIWQMLKETDFFAALFISFVAAFGSLAITGNIWMYRFYKAVLYVGSAAFILLGGKSFWDERKRQDRLLRGKKLFFHANMIFCALMPVFLCIYYSYTMDFQNQGRYILPGIIPMMYYVVAGLKRLADLNWLPARWQKMKRIGGKAADAAVLVTIAFTVGILFWMVFGYAVPVYREIGSVL